MEKEFVDMINEILPYVGVEYWGNDLEEKKRKIKEYLSKPKYVTVFGNTFEIRKEYPEIESKPDHNTVFVWRKGNEHGYWFKARCFYKDYIVEEVHEEENGAIRNSIYFSILDELDIELCEKFPTEGEY